MGGNRGLHRSQRRPQTEGRGHHCLGVASGSAMGRAAPLLSCLRVTPGAGPCLAGRRAAAGQLHTPAGAAAFSSSLPQAAHSTSCRVPTGLLEVMQSWVDSPLHAAGLAAALERPGTRSARQQEVLGTPLSWPPAQDSWNSHPRSPGRTPVSASRGLRQDRAAARLPASLAHLDQGFRSLLVAHELCPRP